MPVIACPDCGRDVSTLAPTCPHCGRPSPAGTTPMPLTAAAPAQEETLWRGSPSYRVLAGKIIVGILALLAGAIAIHYASGSTPDLDRSTRIAHFGWLILAGVAALVIVSLLVAVTRLRSTIYTITNQRVMIETGLLTKSLSEIDLRYIDDTQFFQSFFDRIVAIGNITLISSDKAEPVYVLRGMGNPREMRETIRTHAYRVSQRQIFTRAT